MPERDEGFIGRWSRLKQATRESRDAPESAVAPDQAPAPVASAAETPEQPTAAEPELPPIDGLNRDSDFTPFMRAGVAPELRKQALNKLWRSDPAFANLDGLLEYGEDYTLPFKTQRLVATVYKVGKGMVESALQEPAAVASTEKAAPAPAAVAGTMPSEADSADANSEVEDASAAADSDRDDKG